MGQKWIKLRTMILSVVDTPGFEWMILVLIFASSITLCFEDIYLDDNPFLKRILYWTNLGFCALFSIEMLLKWLALGFCKYFTSFWTILDFIIVFVSRTLNSKSRIDVDRVCIWMYVCANRSTYASECMYNYINFTSVVTAWIFRFRRVQFSYLRDFAICVIILFV